jgi:hypothetical protein
MLNTETITRRASEILAAKKLKPDLSEQAKAVTQSIIEAVNAQLLVNQAQTDKQINAVKETPTGRMKKPTLEEVQAHGVVIGLLNGECEKFFDFYESKGWRVGSQPMKLWTAAMSNWKRRCEQPIATNGNVLVIQNQKALERVEARIKQIRACKPINGWPKGDPELKELTDFKLERTRLMTTLNLKA